MLSSKLIKNATLKVYEGAPHGMCTTQGGSTSTCSPFFNHEDNRRDFFELPQGSTSIRKIFKRDSESQWSRRDSAFPPARVVAGRRSLFIRWPN
jgi:hypothetical protein